MSVPVPNGTPNGEDGTGCLVSPRSKRVTHDLVPHSTSRTASPPLIRVTKAGATSHLNAAKPLHGRSTSARATPGQSQLRTPATTPSPEPAASPTAAGPERRSPPRSHRSGAPHTATHSHATTVKRKPLDPPSAGAAGRSKSCALMTATESAAQRSKSSGLAMVKRGKSPGLLSPPADGTVRRKSPGLCTVASDTSRDHDHDHSPKRRTPHHSSSQPSPITGAPRKSLKSSSLSMAGPRGFLKGDEHATRAPRRGTSPQLGGNRSTPQANCRAPSPGIAHTEDAKPISPGLNKRLVSPRPTVEAMAPGRSRRSHSHGLQSDEEGESPGQSVSRSVEVDLGDLMEAGIAGPSSPSKGPHVYPASQVFEWVDAIQSSIPDEQDATHHSCLVFLCGAPGAGKSYTAQRLLRKYPELVHIFSNDMHPDVYFLRDRYVIFRPSDNAEGQFDFPWFQRNVLNWVRDRYAAQLATRRRAILVFDDTNTVLRDCIEAVAMACQAGIPVAHIGWFIFDQGLPEDEEVEFLVARQHERHETFWAKVDNGEDPPPSDGKVVPTEKIKTFVRRIRSTYFPHEKLVAFSDGFIAQQVAIYLAKEEQRRLSRELRRTAERHLYTPSQLREWVSRALLDGPNTRLVIFLCGAPGSGKSTLARQLAAEYGSRLRVFSNDHHPEVYFLRDGNVVFRPTDNPLGKFEFSWYRDNVLRTVMQQFEEALASEGPQIFLFDDTNTIFKECTEKVAIALRAGIPVQQIVWCILDLGYPEEEEVATLVQRQLTRCSVFQQRLSTDDPLPPCEGKLIAAEKIRQFVKRLRASYLLSDGTLRVFADDWILTQANAFNGKPMPLLKTSLSPPSSPIMHLTLKNYGTDSPERRRSPRDSPTFSGSPGADSSMSPSPPRHHSKSISIASTPRRPPDRQTPVESDKHVLVPRVAHLAVHKGPTARDRINSERQARLAQFVGMTVRSPSPSQLPAPASRVAAVIMGRRGMTPTMELSGQPEVLVLDIDALLVIPTPYVRRWESRSYKTLVAPLREGGLGWYEGATVAHITVEKGCFAQAEAERLPRGKHTPVVVLCHWEPLSTSEEMHSDFQRQVFKTLRAVGWPVDYVLTKDAIASPRGENHQNYVQWCLEQVRMLSGGAAIHLVQTQTNCVEGLPAGLIRKVSTWPAATAPYELSDDVEEAVVNALLHRRDKWGELRGETPEPRWTVESHSSYAGVGLPDKSRQQLLRTMCHLIPEGWQIIAHHMTICMGDLEAVKAKERLEKPNGGKLARVTVGQPVLLLTEAFGKNEEAAAVRVSGFVTNSKLPHITLAVSKGGKPMASNNIEDWQPVPVQRLLGVVRQYKYYHLWKQPPAGPGA